MFQTDGCFGINHQGRRLNEIGKKIIVIGDGGGAVHDRAVLPQHPSPGIPGRKPGPGQNGFGQQRRGHLFPRSGYPRRKRSGRRHFHLLDRPDQGFQRRLGCFLPGMAVRGFGGGVFHLRYRNAVGFPKRPAAVRLPGVCFGKYPSRGWGKRGAGGVCPSGGPHR